MNNIIRFSEYKRGNMIMQDIEKNVMLSIEEKVNNLLSDADFTHSPYVDIVSIVKKDGFKVEPTEMDIDTTGCLLVNSDETNQTRLIMVNTDFKNPDNESDVVFKKSRFITAHEYGHFILHHEAGKPIYAHRDTYHRTEPIELEADYFARSILMPLEQFKLYYEILKDISKNDEKFIIGILSKIFKVTKNKVEKRMGDLLVLNQ